MNDILEGYTAVIRQIAQAAERAGRAADEITLVAVTKTWPVETLLAAYEVGMRHFGENRAEEMAVKRTAVDNILGPDNGIIWHQIGTLQSRKTNLVADHADMFHALDRLKIAQRLSNRLMQTAHAPLPIFLEVNVSGEASKSGWDMREWEQNETQRDNLRTAAQTILDMPGLSFAGLMTMAPWGVAKAEIRNVFRRTRELGQWLETAVSQPLDFSMGMTDDFEIAIEEGATYIRVGRAIFGSRR